MTQTEIRSCRHFEVSATRLSARRSYQSDQVDPSGTRETGVDANTTQGISWPV